MGKEKRNWVVKRVRLEPADARHVEDAAHAARLSVSVFIRTLLLTGRSPKPAPPIQNEMSFGSTVLHAELLGVISNLTQIEQHSIRLGGPFVRLTGSDGVLQKLKKQALNLGLRNKSGALDEVTIKTILGHLQPAALSLNDQLAKPLNQCLDVSSNIWRSVLSTLQTKLSQHEVGDVHGQ